MLPIPPLASVLAAGVQQVQRHTEEKAEQVRRAQNRKKDSAATEDEYIHTVESSDEVQPIHDEDPKRDQPRKPPHKRDGKPGEDQDDHPHLDLKA